MIKRREPDQQGPAGRAWLLKEDENRLATLAGWLVNCPKAHPAWQWWVVGSCHLRDIEGLPTAKKRYPEAEFEFLIFTVDPVAHPEPDPEKPRYRALEPLDVVEQFHGVSDRDAARICAAAVRAIVNGLLSPDQDARRDWRASIEKTVEHFKSGAHVES